MCIRDKLAGEPAVLCYENVRGMRNPLYTIVAMIKVFQKFPKARLHIYNVQDKKMYETFSAYIKHAKLWPFVRSLTGPVDMKNINLLLNKADIVVSNLFPLYARSIEAFGAGKPLVCAGYKEYSDYPYLCDMNPDSIADAIIKAWEEQGKHNWRKYAEERHDAKESTRQCLEIYKRYL